MVLTRRGTSCATASGTGRDPRRGARFDVVAPVSYRSAAVGEWLEGSTVNISFVAVAVDSCRFERPPGDPGAARRRRH